MTNIWIISKYASGPKYGYATRHFFLAKYLAKRNNLKVTVVGSRSLGFTSAPPEFRGNSMHYHIDNVELVVLNGPTINSGFSFLRLWSWIVFEYRLLRWANMQKETPSVVIVSSLSLLTFATGVFLKKRFNAKLLLEVRDIWPLTLQYMKGLSKYNPIIYFLSWIEKFGYRNSDAIIGTMPNLREHIINILPNNEKPIAYIPMGFDSDFFSNNFFSDKIELFFSRIKPKYNFIVGYTGSIGLANAVEELINVAKLLEVYDVAFAILGDGPEKEKLVKICEETQIENVFFHDKVDRKHVQHFLSYCDLLVNPISSNNPVYQYGVSPNKWIDYLYSGKPIIIPFDGFQCIINEAKCGEFIKASDSELLLKTILKYRNMPQIELIEMGKRGKNYLFENLNYSTLADRFYNVIKPS